jgi:hypothetical protein
MPNATLSHHRQGAKQGAVGIDGVDGGRHHFLDRPVQDLGAMRAQIIDHIAFGHDADHCIAIDDRHCTDPAIGQQGHSLRHGGAAGHADHLTAS